jgi:hypothetical protein
MHAVAICGKAFCEVGAGCSAGDGLGDRSGDHRTYDLCHHILHRKASTRREANPHGRRALGDWPSNGRTGTRSDCGCDTASQELTLHSRVPLRTSYRAISRVSPASRQYRVRLARTVHCERRIRVRPEESRTQRVLAVAR